MTAFIILLFVWATLITVAAVLFAITVSALETRIRLMEEKLNHHIVETGMSSFDESGVDEDDYTSYQTPEPRDTNSQGVPIARNRGGEKE